MGILESLILIVLVRDVVWSLQQGEREWEALPIVTTDKPQNKISTFLDMDMVDGRLYVHCTCTCVSVYLLG